MTSEPAVPPLDALLAHREWVRRFARTLVRDEHAAQDLAQETWLAAIEHPPGNVAAPVGWLRRVLLRRAMNRARGERRRGARERTASRPESVAAVDVVTLTESHRCVVEAVLALDEPYRTTVLLRYFEDLAPADVAARMGTSVDNVYARLRRAAERLRERLDEDRGRERRRALFVLLAGPAGAGEGSPAPAGGVAVAAAAGGMLMSTKAILGVGVVVLLLGGWVVWSAHDASPSTVDVARLDEAVVDRSHAQRRTKPTSVDPPIDQQPPVDPDAIAFPGRVVDADGRPLAGVTVVGSVTRPVSELGTPPRFVKSLSAADGTFDLRLPKGTATADVVASAPGFASTAVERARPGAPVEIRLAREGVLVGRVLDPKSKPIAGAAVRAFRVVARERVDVVESTTGADGAFRVGGWAGSRGDDPPMKRPFLDVRAAGFGATQDDGRFPDAGEELRRDVVLFPSRPMNVLVTDADSGAPVEGARVTLGFAATGLQINTPREAGYVLPHPAPYVAEGVSDARGVCVIADAPARFPMLSRLVLRAWKSGFTAEMEQVAFRPPTDDERTEIRLWPSATVTGRVVDATGTPVAGAGVTSFGAEGTDGSWFPAPFGDLPWGGWTTSDAEGRYAMPCVRASAAGTREASLLTWGRQSPLADGRVYVVLLRIVVKVRPRPGEAVVAPDLVLPAPTPTRTASFVVVDLDGRPVAGALVASNGARDAPARTDDAGRALLHWPVGGSRGAPPMDQPSVEFSARGFARTSVRCRPDVATTPETRVVLEPGLRLVGRVREKDGRGFAGASVNAVRDDSSGGHVVADEDGAFVFDDLSSKPCEIVVSTSVGYSRDARIVRFPGAIPGGAPIEIELPPSTTKRGTLIATVTDEDGGPLVESAVDVACDPQTPGAWSSTDTPGVMTLAVPVGTWTITAKARGRISASTTMTIVEGQTTRAVLVLPRGTPLAVRIALPAEYPGRLDGAYLARVDACPGEVGAGDEASSHDWSPDHTELRFDAVAPGRYVLHYAPRHRNTKSLALVAAAPIEVGTPGKSTARVSVELVAGGILSVKVEFPEAVDMPKSGAESAPGAIEVIAPGGERRRVLRGAVRGAARTIGLLAGDYTVRLHLPSGRVRETAATVRVGETTEVAFPAQ